MIKCVVFVLLTAVVSLLLSSTAMGAPAKGIWSAQKAWAWYQKVGPIRGCNYLPRTAVNMTEMWQKETFDPKTIGQEFGWAKKAGYNSVRVFLQYLVWKADPEGMKKRIDEFLAIADKNGISAMLMFFCDCSFAGKEPYLGKQDEPVPGVHNSGWVPSPGLKRVTDRSVWGDLEKYVKDIVTRFGKDRRVLIWDLYNEPGNSGMGEKSLPLVEAAFKWTRQCRPAQPVTIGAWTSFNSRMSKRIMALSDVVSFHGYDSVAGMQAKITTCQALGRPILCTEWLRRQVGNTFAAILPMFAANKIGGYHWGLVAGRTQTFMHWGSKKGSPLPKVWQHDTFGADGKPYDAKEIEMLRAFTFYDVKVIVPASDEAGQEWRYTLAQPPADWTKGDWDDSQWKAGPGAFGVKDIPTRAAARTPWKTPDIWLRRSVTLESVPGAPGSRPHLKIHHDEDAEVYINGVLAAKLAGFTADFVTVPLPAAARKALRVGRNVIAVHCHQTAGGQYIDVGIVDMSPR